MSTDPIARAIAESRRRLVARGILLAGLSALAGGSICAAALEAQQFASENKWIGGVPEISIPLAVGSATAVGGMIGAGFSRSLRVALGRKRLVRALDGAAGFELGLATAHEAAAAQSGLAAGLVAEMQARAAGLNIKVLWPIWRRESVALLAVSVLALGSYAGLVGARTPHMAVNEPVVQASVEDIRETAQRLVEQLKREALVRQDPLLDALARALEERVVQAEGVSAEALESALEGLIEQAQAAFGEQVPSWLNRQRAGEMNSAAQGQTATGGRRSTEQLGDDLFAMNVEEIEALKERRRQLDLLDGLKSAGAEMEAPGGEVTAGTSEAPPSAALSSQTLEPKDMMLAGREAVGAAAESGKGPADQAGAGTQALEGEALAAGAAGAEDMALPEAAQETGRRIRIALPPSEDEQAQGLADSGAAGSSAGVSSPVLVGRSTAKTGARGALARYFEQADE